MKVGSLGREMLRTFGAEAAAGWTTGLVDVGAACVQPIMSMSPTRAPHRIARIRPSWHGRDPTLDSRFHPEIVPVYRQEEAVTG
jgi:hypothetical protein